MGLKKRTQILSRKTSGHVYPKFRSLNVKNASYFEFDLFEFVSDFVLRISSLPTRSG